VTVLLALAISAVAAGTNGAYMAGGWGLDLGGEKPIVLGIAMVLDGLSRLFLLMVAAVSTAIVLFSLRYLEDYTAQPLFYSLLSLLIAGMCGAVLAGDMFNLFVFVEIASMASYGLVAFGTGGREVEAAFKYLVLGSLASTGILLGVGALYACTGFLNMAQLSDAIAAGQVPDPVLLFASVLFLAGFGLKAAMMPFHAWLPDAHPSAPAPISAALSGLLIKTLGIYAIVRVFFTVIGMTPQIQTLLLLLGCISMVGGVLLALGQDDLKRLLAYSSISQMGYVLVALGINTWLGVAAALFHAANHAAFKSALFLSSGSLERLTGTRRMSEMGGLVHRAPATSVGTIGASLSISGVPPFNGFWSKLLILIALIGAGSYWVAGIAAATAVLTLTTFIKVQKLTVFGALPERLAKIREVPSTMFVPVLLLVLLCLAMGLLWPYGVESMIGSAASAVKANAPDASAAAGYIELVTGR
jgi:multicomponent Na+:H+ antiporter subunit D